MNVRLTFTKRQITILLLLLDLEVRFRKNPAYLAEIQELQEMAQKAWNRTLPKEKNQ